MTNWKQLTILAALAGLTAVAHAQGGGQGKMHQYGASGTQPTGQGGHQGGGQGSQARMQARSQDGTQIGGEAAVRERMRTHTSATTPTTSTTQ
ncbi:hypothetical protein [Malikia granosa]|uniref:Uncharacterized protein n=1 Tax=Malikia granosa TaxID=263067 RepID=A0A2S9K5U9_9BURK|nr:hypothetical protein [Malikia granosa]PRD65839.1 hypothetical protein C6P64_06985 [Malikia granosa]